MWREINGWTVNFANPETVVRALLPPSIVISGQKADDVRGDNNLLTQFRMYWPETLKMLAKAAVIFKAVSPGAFKVGKIPGKWVYFFKKRQFKLLSVACTKPLVHLSCLSYLAVYCLCAMGCQTVLVLLGQDTWLSRNVAPSLLPLPWNPYFIWPASCRIAFYTWGCDE